MSLTLPAAYSSASKLSNIQENWIVQLYYDDGSSFTPISLADTTVGSVFYHGVITNVPSIRSSINLAKSTAKTGNISLSVANFQYKGDDFSAELFLGTRKYINRNVKIYSQLNGDSTLSNCLQIYQGRLIDISHDDGSITLQLTEQRPWDFITVPQTLSNDKNYQPVAYGDFTFNYGLTGSADATEANKLHDADGGFTSEMQFSGAIVINTTDDTHSEITGFIDSGELTLGEDIFVDTEEYLITDFLSNKKFYPAPFDLSTANKRWNILTAAESGGDDTKPHYYNKSAKVFIPIAGGDSNTSSINGVNSVSYPVDFERVLNFRPNSINAGNDFDDPDHSYDSDIFGSESSDDGTATYGSTVDTDLIVGVPDVIGKFTKLYLLVRAYADLNATTGFPIGGVTLTNETYGTSDTIVQRATPAEGTGTNSSGTAGESEYYMRDMMTEYTNNDFKLPDEVKLNMLIQVTGGSGSISGSVRVYDIFFAGEIALDHTNEPDASQKILDDIDFVYVGSDGLSNSFTGGTGIADTGLEAHRDLLFRFTGFDDSDGDIYNYDANLDIEAARITTAWNIRWWALEPVELKKVLEQLQYEFCFIFKWRNGLGSYWFIKDSYSSGDVAQTLKKDDITNLKINNTPFSQLLTDMRISYEKHPAEDRFLSTQTSKDTTNNPRTSWNIQSKENIKEIKLDMNVNKPGNANPGGGDPNDGFADYMMNIFGDIKKIISCDIVNPAVSYNLETGDIIQFSNTAGEMPVEPFGDDWQDYYMITNLNRSPGKMSITCREVG